jgi:hypothetical protein
MHITIRRAVRQLSAPLVTLAAALFTIGVIVGLCSYLGRSPIPQRHVPGSSAWLQHLAVAVLACAALGYGRWLHRRRFGRHSGRLWLLAPLGKPAARRVTWTIGALRSPSGLGRALLALPPAALFLYFFARAGEQVTGGLDPNFTVNAWGGPTYLGAMACHYLDGFMLMAAAACLLDLILRPDRGTVRRDSDPPAGARPGDPAVPLLVPDQHSPVSAAAPPAPCPAPAAGQGRRWPPADAARPAAERPAAQRPAAECPVRTARPRRLPR